MHRIALLAVLGVASAAGTLYPMEESLALVCHSW
jgi:cytochrome c biogenesis protein ResB